MGVQDYLNVIAPSLATATDSVAVLIPIAEDDVPQDVRNRELAMAYYIAHHLEMANRGGIDGAITSDKEGDLARTYSGGGNGLASTAFGRQYRIMVGAFGGINRAF